MTRPTKMALRFTAIAAALVVIPAALGPSSPPSTPYVSVLSKLIVSDVIAGKCDNKICQVGSVKGDATCVKSEGQVCHLGGSGNFRFCTTTGGC